MSLEITFTKRYEKKDFKSKTYSMNFLNAVKELYTCKHSLDTVVIAGLDNFEAGAYKLALMASSDHFLDAFWTNKSSLDDVIRVDNIDGEALTLVLDFIHTGQITLSKETFKKVYDASTHLRIPDLRATCCDFMEDQLEPGNCISIANFAWKEGLDCLFDKALAFMITWIDSVCDTDEFKHLSSEQFIDAFLRNSPFEMEQHALLQTVVKWIEYDVFGRSKNVSDIFQYIMYTELTPEYIITTTKPICKTIECYEAVHDWLEWHLVPEGYLNKQRPPNQLAAITRNFGVELFEENTQTWRHEEWPSPCDFKTAYGIIIINKKLFVVGGRINEQLLTTIQFLNLSTLTWQFLPEMREPRCCPALSYISDKLYVIGGETEDGWSVSVESYDFYSCSWKSLRNLPFRIKSINSVVLREKIYVHGRESIAINCYDPLENTWSAIQSVPGQELEFQLAADDKFLYAMGQLFMGTSLLRLERYCPVEQEWYNLAPLDILPFSLKSTSLIRWNNRLILCIYWALDGQNHVNTIHKYEMDTDTWTAFPSWSNQKEDNITYYTFVTI